MVYTIKEYNHVFETPAKKQQELAVANKIMDLLNKNKYGDLEDFISKNNNYQSFLKNNEMENVVKHFGNTLSEQDYIQILQNLRILTKNKQDFNKENIKTTNIDDKVFNSFTGQDKTYFLDNSKSDKTIEEQMRDLQQTQQQFQTSDMNKNTENMFKELEKNKKQSLNLRYLYEIDYNLLTNEQKVLYQIVQNYEHSIDGTIRIDLDRQIIVNEQNEIMKIEKENGEFIIKNGDDKDEDNIEYRQQHSHQKTLTMNKDTIYSNNN